MRVSASYGVVLKIQSTLRCRIKRSGLVRCAELVGSGSQLVGLAVGLGRERKRVYWSLSVLVTADVVKVYSKGKE